MPNVIVIAGPNGAGKSTLAPALLRDTLNIPEYVNADTIAEGLSAFAPENASFEAGRVMLQRLNELARQRENLSFETTLATRFYANWIKGLQKSGYRFTLMFLWLENAELAKERVKERVRLGGHSIPSETIGRRYERGLNNLFNLYLPIANTWSLRNTSGARSVEIARYTDEEGQRVFDEALWNQIRAKAKT